MTPIGSCQRESIAYAKADFCRIGAYSKAVFGEPHFLASALVGL